MGDFDTASRIPIADIFSKKRKVKIEKNKGQNNSKSISHQKINVNGLEIDPNLNFVNYSAFIFEKIERFFSSSDLKKISLLFISFCVTLVRR